MRVLFIVTAYKRSDEDVITPWMTELILNLKERGVDVEVFAPSYKGLREHTVDGIRVRRFRYFFSRWESLTHDQTAPDRLERGLFVKLLVPFFVVGGIIGIVRLVRKEKYDILQAHWPIPSFILARAGGMMRDTRIVSSFYGVELRWVRNKLPFLKSFLRWAINGSDAVTAITSSTASEITLVQDTDVRIIPYSVGLGGKSAPADEPDGATSGSDSDGVILFAGRLVERKGVDYLLRALKSVRDKHDARLVIVGDGPERERLVALAVELGIENAVTFAGFVDDDQLAGYYRACSMLVLPAVFDRKGDTEGQGVVLVEAMSFGKPVIASGIGGIRDVVVDGETGILVPEKECDRLSAAIIRLLDDREMARAMGSRGYERYHETYRWEAITDKWIDLYSTLIEKQDEG